MNRRLVGRGVRPLSHSRGSVSACKNPHKGVIIIGSAEFAPRYMLVALMCHWFTTIVALAYHWRGTGVALAQQPAPGSKGDGAERLDSRPYYYSTARVSIVALAQAAQRQSMMRAPGVRMPYPPACLP